jgi:DEAD/DEAH box helicase domain-containing protein
MIPPMAQDIVYFDLETQRTANDAGGWDRKCNMRMSIGVIYSTATGKYQVFDEAKVNNLIDRLRPRDLVVGFNVLNFDYHVLMGYTILDLVNEIPTADLMADVEKRLGHRLGLDSIANATLGVQKTAAGLDAIKWWREGRVLEIAEYCCFDVKVTKMVHEHGCRHKELFFHDASRNASAWRSTGAISTNSPLFNRRKLASGTPAAKRSLVTAGILC